MIQKKGKDWCVNGYQFCKIFIKKDKAVKNIKLVPAQIESPVHSNRLVNLVDLDTFSVHVLIGKVCCDLVTLWQWSLDCLMDCVCFA